MVLRTCHHHQLLSSEHRLPIKLILIHQILSLSNPQLHLLQLVCHWATLYLLMQMQSAKISLDMYLKHLHFLVLDGRRHLLLRIPNKDLLLLFPKQDPLLQPPKQDRPRCLNKQDYLRPKDWQGLLGFIFLQG